MKKIYITPAFDLIEIQTTNIVCASPTPDYGGSGTAGDNADSKTGDIEFESFDFENED